MPESRTHSGKALYISFILIRSLVYGIGNPLTKVAYHSITPLWLLAARFSLAFLLFALFFGRRLFSQLRKVSWTLWLPSALCCAATNEVYSCISRSSASESVLNNNRYS